MGLAAAARRARRRSTSKGAHTKPSREQGEARTVCRFCLGCACGAKKKGLESHTRPAALPPARRFKKEQRARCRVFEEWLAAYKKDESPKHKTFFAGYLKQNYEDFAAYRAVADSGGEAPQTREEVGLSRKRKLVENIAQMPSPS